MLTTEDISKTAFLLGMFGVIDRTAPVLLNLFFKMEQTFDTEEVYWDQVQRARSLAPLCIPTVAGKPQRSRGYQTLGVKPPYLKPKHIVEPTKAIKRRVGERLLGEMTPQQRFQLAIMDNMYLQDDSITRREEWMAANLMINGTVTLASPDHPPIIVSLNRLATHTFSIAGGSLAWGQPGVDPLRNMQDWAAMVQADSGFHPSTVVMDQKAARLFMQAPSVMTVMQSFRQTQGNIDLAGKVTGGAPGQEVKYLGTLGEFDIYQYQQLYADDSGVVHQLMPPNTVIMANETGVQGIRTYGAIMDAESLIPLPRFPKVWLEKDPSAYFAMTQSAPLPILGWPNASAAITVA